MEEIKVGEYVRTKNGYIEKVTETDNNYVYSDGILSYQFQGDVEIPNSYEEKSKIVKHSENIIDLIEVDDYVNGSKVIYICESQYGGERIIYIGGFGIPKKIYANMIKSIVTYEQFDSVEYKIGGENE